MGDKTFTLFQSDLTMSLGNRDDISAYVGNWTNVAYLTLTTQGRFWGLKRDFYFPELETSESKNTSDGVNYIAIPTDALVVRSLFNTTSKIKLNNMALSKFLAYTDRADTSAEAAPNEWLRQGSSLYLHPTPDTVYAVAVHYRKRPAALAAAGATTVIGAEWDEPISLLATAQSWLRLRNYVEYKAIKEEFIQAVSGLMGLYFQEEADRRDYMRPDPGILEYKYR